MSKSKKSYFDEWWIELGKKSFARFYDLSIEEVELMMKNPNDVFYEMLQQMDLSLRSYENFLVKVRKPEKYQEEISRTEFIDLGP